MTIESFCNDIWNTSYSNVLRDIKKTEYKTFVLPKKNGCRTINYLPEDSKLRNLQEQLSLMFFEKQGFPIVVKGFAKGEGYLSYLKRHIGSKYFLRVDILEFFSSITKEILKKELSIIVKSRTKEDKKYIIDLICDVVLLNDCLPQGAITSPIVSNLVMARIDQRILKYCQVFGIRYTRYADDMLFSSNNFNFKERKWFLKKIKYILNYNKLKLNYSKIKHGFDEISLSGFVVSDTEIRLSRERLADIRGILRFSKMNSNLMKTDENEFLKKLNEIELKHRDLEKYPFKSKFQFVQYLCGYRAFLISITDAYSISAFQKDLKKLIAKMERHILLYM